MGMDPIGAKETLELVFEIQGDGKSVKRGKFKFFQKAVDDFLEACKDLETGNFEDDGVTKKKFKVRLQRSSVRKKLED
jgi:predicted HicB family RNase H-like nuclease